MTAEQTPLPAGVVDAVVTWVDGADPAHARKRAKMLDQGVALASSTIPAGVDGTRFEDNNEIEYCLRSIRRFAPWVRTIFLVTDEQRPRFLTEELRLRLGVQVVDHRHIFAGHEDVLPTFNSLSIETALHRIPGLAAQYVYLNDDFILMAPTRVEDFFTADGEVVLRGGWQALRAYGPTRLSLSKLLNRVLKSALGINRAMSVLQQMRGAEQAGAFRRFFKVSHAPYPLRKSTLEQYFEAHPDVFARNIADRFRSLDQYAVTSLANQLEIARGQADLRAADDVLMVCFNRDSRTEIQRKIERVRRNDVRFLCVQSLEQASEEDRQALKEGIERAIGM